MNSKSSIDEKKIEIQSLIEKVEAFPQHVSYEAFVPLSKVGFCKGRIVHTNEFIVTQPMGNEVAPPLDPHISSARAPEQFKSHTEVLDMLRAELDTMGGKKKAAVSHQSPTLSGARNSTDSSSRSSGGSSSSSSRGGGGGGGGSSSRSSSAAQPLRSALKGSSASIPSVGDTDPVPMQDEPIFEIREYIDEKGETRFEKVDVTKQFQAVHSSLSAAAAEEDGDGATLGSVKDLPPTENAEMSFVRELCVNNSKLNELELEAAPDGPAMQSLDDFFAKLELQESQRLVSDRGEKDLVSAGSSGRGGKVQKNSGDKGRGGWGSGFLGTKKSSPGAARVSTAATATSTNSHSDKKSVSFGVPDQPEMSSLNIVATAADSSGESPKSPAPAAPAAPAIPKVQAFTGSVLERPPAAAPKPLVFGRKKK